jgi:glycosyltransferase involved in cell wall biosynthesis
MANVPLIGRLRRVLSGARARKRIGERLRAAMMNGSGARGVPPLFDARWYAARHRLPLSSSAVFAHYLRSGLFKGYDPHPLFSSAWYAGAYPDVAASGIPPFLHYVEHGARERRSPHPLFEPAWYERRIENGAAVGNLLEHFVEDGAARGLSPHPLFDAGWYARQLGTKRGRQPTFTDYLRSGAREGLSPHPLFDVAYYLGQVPDRAAAARDPLAHYLAVGAARGLSPHPLFDGPSYAARYEDVARSGVAPLLHYVEHGARELRDPHPLFSAEFYLSQVADPAGARENPLAHFVTRGAMQGVSPFPLFDREWYLSANPPAVRAADPFLRFVLEGDRAGESSHPLFDPVYYLRHNPDVAAARMGPLRHFAEHGGVEGRTPHPMFDSQYYNWLHPHVRERRINPLVHYLMQPRESRRHPHPLFDGAYQRITSAAARTTTADPLRDYVQFRAALDPDLVARHATSIPAPRRALLPNRPERRPPPPPRTPLVSVLIPVYEPAEDCLREAVDSVRAQRYVNWELILVDDGSARPHVAPLLDALAALDRRITVIRRRENGGISRATNDALRAAAGEYVALVDHDDVLAADALDEMVAALVRTSAEAAYSDQAYVSARNAFESAFHKPRWSPALFAGVMYVGHVLVVKRETALAVGGFDGAYDRVQDFEFMLRVGERTGAIEHVPKILYRWRKIPGSVALDSNSKGPIEPIQAAAVDAHFKRIGFPARAVPQPALHHRLRIVPLPRARYPAIDVLVRGDRPREAVERAQAELARHRAKLDGRITVVGRRAKARRGGRTEVVEDVKRRLAEDGAPFVLFVDPSVERVASDWLEHLLLYAERPDVAFVAPHLVRENGLTVAAGLVATPSGLVPAMPGWRRGEDGYAGSLACDREVSALPPGLLLFARAKLARAGGIADDLLTPYYAFGEAALRARDAGFRNVAVAAPLATVPNEYELIEPDAAVDALLATDTAVWSDPYYNENFSEAADYAPAVIAR